MLRIYIYVGACILTHTHTHMYRHVRDMYDKGLYITDNNDKYRDSITNLTAL